MDRRQTVMLRDESIKWKIGEAYFERKVLSERESERGAERKNKNGFRVFNS